MDHWAETIPVKPQGKARARSGRNGHYTPTKTKDSENSIGLWLKAKGAPLFSGAVYMEIIFIFVRPKSAKKRLYHTVKPDIDNCLKLFMDASNGILFDDDKQVVKLISEKIYGEMDCIQVLIKEVG